MEIIANAVQTFQANQNVYFTDTVVCGNCSISHRDDSGLVTLRGVTNCQSRARFMVTFGGNIAIPTGGTVEAISLAIAIDGEAAPATTMITTPAAVEQYSNVKSSIFIDVPRGCCSTISVQNTSTQAISIQNANLIITRVA
jgi:hypothetical protein